jgi:hypothetical protein
MRVFISQPMKNKTNEEILSERERAIKYIKENLRDGDSVEIVDSFFQDAPHDAKPLWFLGKSLELLSTADMVYFCKDWEKARGCRIEHECAEEYGIPIISLW